MINGAMKIKFSFTLFCLVVTQIAYTQVIWSPAISLNSSNSTVNWPRVVVNSIGDPLVIWGESGELMFSRRVSGAFTQPIALNTQGTIISEAFWHGPEIASKGDTVYVVYKLMPETDSTKHMYCVRSFDGGITFSTPKRIDYIGNNMSRFPAVAVGSDGNPVVAFMKSDLNYHDPQWYVVKSNDYGDTFGTPIKASGYNSPNAEACDCCPGSISVIDSTIVVAYRDNNNNIRDTWLGISQNDGSSFYNVRIDTANWLISVCPSSGPDLYMRGDSVATVYMNGASQAKTLLSVYQLADSTLSIEPIPGSIVTNFSNYPRIDLWNNTQGMTWREVQTGKNFIKMNIRSSGIPTTTYKIDSGNIIMHDIALSNHEVFTVWQHNTDRKIKIKTGIIGFINLDEIPIKQVTLYPNPTTRLIHIQSNQSISTVNLMNINGQHLPTKWLDEETLDLSALPVGTYFIFIEFKDSIFIERIIKN